MLTYLGMTMPMAVFALITWLKNSYQGNKAQITVNKLTYAEYGVMIILAIAVTAVFYLIL